MIFRVLRIYVNKFVVTDKNKISDGNRFVILFYLISNKKKLCQFSTREKWHRAMHVVTMSFMFESWQTQKQIICLSNIQLVVYVATVTYFAY